jgi:hypothetical protein
MEQLPVEARALAEAMRTELRAPWSGSWKPSATLSCAQSKTEREQLQDDERLRWLHRNWDLGPARDKPPVAGGVRSHMRRLAWRLIKPTLDPYFRQEQDVLANLLRMVDTLAKQVDAVHSDQAPLAAVGSDLVDLAGYLEAKIADIGGRA